MIASALLVVGGLALMRWRPRHLRQGRAPRSMVALLLAAAAAVWAGSFGLVAAAVSSEPGGIVTACGALWSQLVAGQLAWWQTVVALSWGLLLPVRGLCSLARSLARGHRTRTKLLAGAAPLVGSHPRVFAVSGLATPALTLGLVRPAVFVDEAFWAQASARERGVVLSHELAHRRGGHVVVDAVARVLNGGLVPLATAGAAYAAVRRHLEAIADDVAAADHGREVVGRVLGTVALRAVPAAGLPAAGDSLWRVQRLLAAPPGSIGGDHLVVTVVSLAAAASAAISASVSLSTLGAVTAAFCPL